MTFTNPRANISGGGAAGTRSGRSPGAEPGTESPSRFASNMTWLMGRALGNASVL